jgi:hypothetical protein
MKKIYGLIDPRDHEVRYIGQSGNPELRLTTHIFGAKRGNKPMQEWIRGLHPLVPILVILESVETRRIWTGVVSVSLASVLEAKWLKRFRRTLLNRWLRGNSIVTWDWLTNPDERER